MARHGKRSSKYENHVVVNPWGLPNNTCHFLLLVSTSFQRGLVLHERDSSSMATFHETCSKLLTASVFRFVLVRQLLLSDLGFERFAAGENFLLGFPAIKFFIVPRLLMLGSLRSCLLFIFLTLLAVPTWNQSTSVPSHRTY